MKKKYPSNITEVIVFKRKRMHNIFNGSSHGVTSKWGKV